MAMNRDMRNETVDGSSAKDFRDTKLNNPIAREPANYQADNSQKQHVNSPKSFGTIGAKGRGGN